MSSILIAVLAILCMSNPVRGDGAALKYNCRGAWEWTSETSRTASGRPTYEVGGVTYNERAQMAETWSIIREFDTAELKHCAELCVTTCHCDGFKLRANKCHLVKNSKCSNLPDQFPCVAVSEGEELYMEKLHASCKSLQLPGCTTKDGEYRLNVGPQNQWPSALIYCHEMNTPTPTEFITMPKPSKFIYASADVSKPNQGRQCRHTQFNKVKIDPNTLIIDQSAAVPFTTDTTPTGRSNPTVRKGFGIASGCSYYAPCVANDRNKNVGKMSIDFSGTSFTIPNTTFLDSRTKHLVQEAAAYFSWRPYIRECSSELKYTFTVATGSTLGTGTCTDTTGPSVSRRIYLKHEHSTQTLTATVDGTCGRLIFSDAITSQWNVFRLACI